MAGHTTCIPSTQEAEAGESQVQSQPELHGKIMSWIKISQAGDMAHWLSTQPEFGVPAPKQNLGMVLCAYNASAGEMEGLLAM